MKKFIIFCILFFAIKNSFAQSCVPTSSTVYINIGCSEFPYSYHGATYYSPGEYQVTLQNSAGCDSNVTLELGGTTAATYDTITLTQCQLPYYWYQDITGPGTYYWIGDGGSPECYYSISYLTVYVTPVDTPRSHVTVCSASLPYVLNGEEFYESGVYTTSSFYPQQGENPCDYEILTLTVLPSPVSTTNVTVCANKLPYHWNGKDYTTAGIYKDSIHINGSCDSIATLNLTVTPNTASTSNLTLCADLLPYAWNGQSLTAGGTYTAVIPHAGCDSIATLNLTVKPLSTITSFTPAIGSTGQAVVISGTNFVNVSAVNFGGSPASSFSVQSATSIIATVGANASGAVTVTTPCNTSALGGFTYNTSPGNMGVGIANPTSKFTIGGGDLQIHDIGSGIILKSPNGNCWHITIDNSGNLIRTQIPCP